MFTKYALIGCFCVGAVKGAIIWNNARILKNDEEFKRIIEEINNRAAKKCAEEQIYNDAVRSCKR
jgi:hypothetical protein